MILLKFWNNKLLGIFGAIYQFIPAIYLMFIDKLSSKLQCMNITCIGKHIQIQAKGIIRFPKNITLSERVHIGRAVELSTEVETSYLKIEEYSQISKNCYLDYTGNLTIGKNCTLSEEVMIQTHSHGLSPKNKPIPLSLQIDDNVWIGAKACILHNVNRIGENSIIAACAVVTKDVPKNVIVAGNPAQIIRNI